MVSLKTRKIGRAVFDHYSHRHNAVSNPISVVKVEKEATRQSFRHARTMIYVPGLASKRRSEKSESLRATFTKPPFNMDFVTIDMNGHGDADGELLNMTVSKCIEDLSGVVNSIPVSKSGGIILVGYSLGAIVAAFTSTHFVNRIHALVLLAPGIDFRSRLEGNLCRDKKRIIIPSAYCDPIVLSTDILNDFDSYDDSKLNVETIPIPSLVIHGTQDDVIPFTTVNNWHTSIFSSRPPAINKLVLQPEESLIQFPSRKLIPIQGGNHRMNTDIDVIIDVSASFINKISA